ncbi:hypothetical protein LCW13_04120 [Cobetia amphilecti]|uniref:hypothetical protein n=1 Tax=Cobetia amphilecti TaxID=1055104 RepID=UPI001CDB1B32|nr:hypothetical protein [Cobetia amphilecti]UBU49452.1 hypothetical protein LCW13_04120 [Cobetia amphilecti]
MAKLQPHSAQAGGINAWHEKARPVSRAGFLPADGVSNHCLERWPSISDAKLQEAKFEDARLKQRSTAQIR